MKKLVFYCQHVLGIGHLVRSTEIIRALTGNFSVWLVSGGQEVPGFEFPPGVQVVHLPALRTDADFGELQVCDEEEQIEALKNRRKDMLLSVLANVAPDVFMVELFPFGRKRFGFELLPALQRLRELKPETKIVCSLRDILVSKRDQAQHEERVCKLVNRYFDLVLVHGDARFQTLDDTFSRVADLVCPVRYTGYVMQRPRTWPASLDRTEETFILASIGSGGYAYGHQLLESLIGAAPLLKERMPHELRIFAGPFMPVAEFSRLEALARMQPNVRFERYTPDLLPMMRRAALSISMGGYNTLMNVLSAETRAIVFPYTSNGDLEQRIRAEKLADLGILRVIHPADLPPDVLAETISSALLEKPARFGFDFGGAENTANMLQKMLELQPEPVA